MNMHCTLNRIIAGTLLSGGVAVAGLGLAAGAAQAQPADAARALVPGRPTRAGGRLDPTVYHDYHWGLPGLQVPVEGAMPPPMSAPSVGLFP